MAGRGSIAGSDFGTDGKGRTLGSFVFTGFGGRTAGRGGTTGVLGTAGVAGTAGR